jgi:hypothetical protein
MNNMELAAYISRTIFRVGDEPGDHTQRIAFKNGKWPDAETEGGGLCEDALTRVICNALDNLPPTTPASQS